jgi:hypothetical protein
MLDDVILEMALAGRPRAGVLTPLAQLITTLANLQEQVAALTTVTDRMRDDIREIRKVVSSQAHPDVTDMPKVVITDISPAKAAIPQVTRYEHAPIPYVLTAKGRTRLLPRAARRVPSGASVSIALDAYLRGSVLLRDLAAQWGWSTGYVSNALRERAKAEGCLDEYIARGAKNRSTTARAPKE